MLNLKPTPKSIGVLEDAIPNKQDHNDGKIIQDVANVTAHALIIPLLFGVTISFIVGLAYFFVAVVLYSTIFKEKKELFFTMVAFEATLFLGYILLVVG